jgi:ferredoxin
MKAWNMFGGAIPILASSGYVAEISDECMGCGDCVSTCNFFAISMDENEQKAVVDLEKCMGCGVCEDKCSTGAISLRRDPSKGEPLDLAELLNKV